MLPRVILALAIIIVLTEPTVAASVVKVRILTEDASARQCRDAICATVQVTRSTFSDGDVETILVVSAYDPSGHAIIPVSFTSIDNALFVMNRRGTHASLNHPSAMVTWAADGLYSEESASTMKVIDKRENPFNPPNAFRLTEQAHILGALAEGTVGDITAVATAVAIDTDVPPSAGFGEGFLTIRKTTRIERVLP